MADVLSQIPGLAGYLAMENQRRQAALADLKGVSGLASLLQQQREAALQEQMAPLKMQALQAQADEAQRKGQSAQAFEQAIAGLPAQQQALARLAPGQFVTGAMKAQNPDAGVPTMLAKAISERAAAESRGDAQTVAFYDSYIPRLANGFNPLQFGRYQGLDFPGQVSRSRAMDEGIGVPVPGTLPVPGMPQAPQAAQPSAPMPQQPAQQTGEVSFPSSGRAPAAARDRILAQELQAAEARGDAEGAATISREMQIQSFAGTPQATAPAQSSTGLPPALDRRVKAQALQARNADFIEKSYRPTIADMQSAKQGNNLIDAYRSIPLSKRTGWGTQTIATAANILTGMGIAPDQAKAIAADAQMFNSLMMQQNWQMLVEQKGVQTEGDAQRARLVFAQLGNTPEANEFIWDMTKALNDNKIEKGKFFAERYGPASQSGDLASIETEWVQKNKGFSLFDQPSMKKWKGRAGSVKTESGIPKIANEAEYNALPSGARYIDPNGVERTKR